MSKTVSSAAVSGTIVENNLVPFGSSLHRRDGRTITELGHLSCQANRQCRQRCQGWTYHGWQESEIALNRGSGWRTLPHTRFANRNAIPQQPIFSWLAVQAYCACWLLTQSIQYTIYQYRHTTLTRQHIQHTPQHIHHHHTHIHHTDTHFSSSFGCVHDDS